MSNCIACGPGLLHLARQPDERVGIGDMMDSTHVMAQVLADLLSPQSDEAVDQVLKPFLPS